MKSQRLVLYSSLLIGAAVCAAAWAPVFGYGGAPFRTLIVGGGPDEEHNQVAIESNVRYFSRVMPAGSPTRVLFTDGNPDSKNIQCQDEGEKIFYKKPDISRIDGPSELSSIRSEIATIATDAHSNPASPVLLYFTGHGSPDPSSEFNNNSYDLWNHKHLSVSQLSESLKEFPKSTPITLIMVECFSGAFGNTLFEGGDPGGALADLNLCGFFASVAQRPAAGCTPELKEANYRDFTSYFIAALTGVDRLGNKVTGADYNRDGRVGMNEAFAYSLIHDDSIDTPVCTSDVFLRHFVKTPDRDVMTTPFSDIQRWATRSQRVALDWLADSINMRGEDRVQRAYDTFLHTNLDSDELKDVHLIRFVRLAKSIILAHVVETSSDETVKSRFHDLLRAESGNPFVPER
ncbi:MAG: hypothetical protein P4L46_24305 [Fimbriimonas sp.]|nr:hypothetical protein [Fimbriimonas sp.]